MFLDQDDRKQPKINGLANWLHLSLMLSTEDSKIQNAQCF